MAPKISVIVPVYNTEKYLSRCLDSVIAQTFKNIEIIIVNDGSPDGSMTIINRYADKYDNIIVIEKENQGLAEARRSGINIATGDYIMHVDSDDWIPDNTIELLHNKCIEYDLDYARGTYYDYFSDKYKPLYQYQDTGILIGKEFLYYVTRSDVGLSSWASLCKRSIWQEDVFPPSHLNLPSEDYFINFKLGVHIKRAGIFNEIPAYYYCQNPNSLTSTGALSKNQKNWDIFYKEVRIFLDNQNLLQEFEERLHVLELDKLAFYVDRIIKNDDWYKMVCKYDPSSYPTKYKILHYLIRYPDLCRFVINTNRRIKRFIVKLKCIY